MNSEVCGKLLHHWVNKKYIRLFNDTKARSVAFHVNSNMNPAEESIWNWRWKCRLQPVAECSRTITSWFCVIPSSSEKNWASTWSHVFYYIVPYIIFCQAWRWSVLLNRSSQYDLSSQSLNLPEVNKCCLVPNNWAGLPRNKEINFQLQTFLIIHEKGVG